MTQAFKNGKMSGLQDQPIIRNNWRRNHKIVNQTQKSYKEIFSNRKHR